MKIYLRNLTFGIIVVELESSSQWVELAADFNT